MSIIVPDIAELLQLQLLLDSLIDTAVVHLFSNNITPDEDTVLGDFTECTYSGYGGGQTPTWDGPTTDMSNRAAITSEVMQYAHNGGATANTVYGYYVVASGTDLVFCERFAAPIVMDDATDQFSLQIVYRLREDS